MVTRSGRNCRRLQILLYVNYLNDMESKQILEKFILTHPNYWDFEDEIEEVKRLKSAIENNEYLDNKKGQ